MLSLWGSSFCREMWSESFQKRRQVSSSLDSCLGYRWYSRHSLSPIKKKQTTKTQKSVSFIKCTQRMQRRTHNTNTLPPLGKSQITRDPQGHTPRLWDQKEKGPDRELLVSSWKVIKPMICCLLPDKFLRLWQQSIPKSDRMWNGISDGCSRVKLSLVLHGVLNGFLGFLMSTP